MPWFVHPPGSWPTQSPCAWSRSCCWQRLCLCLLWLGCCILSPAPPLLGCLCFQVVGLWWEEQAEFLSGETPSFLCQDSVGEPLYMLFRGIKHQVDKGPVDWVTGKAKYTLNDNRLLREDLEYRTLVSAKSFVPSGLSGAQG